MADITITAADVLKTTTTAVTEGIAGGTITAGMPVYIDTAASGVLKACDADVAATSVCAGIALHSAASGQPIKYAYSGSLTISAVMTVGQIYVVSTTAGGVAPYADLASGDFVSILGVASTSSNLILSINNSGIAKP